MLHISTSRVPRHRIAPTRLRFVLTWLCVVLILVTGSVHLLHQHQQGNDSTTCGLCAVAHLSVLHVTVVPQPVVVEAYTSFTPQAATAPPPRFFHPSLYVRPPPASTPPWLPRSSPPDRRQIHIHSSTLIDSVSFKRTASAVPSSF